jgi:hypothetical protein
MSRRSPFVGWILVLTLMTGMSSGCVDRRFVIESDPPNANVYVNNKLIGATPVDAQFTYYGKYRFVFDRDGYQRLTVDEDIRTPWYEWFPLEFIAENLLPFTIRDIHYIGIDPDGKRKPLPPIQNVPPEETLKMANALREKAQAIGQPERPEPGGLLPVPGVIAPGAPPDGGAAVTPVLPPLVRPPG